ncbi:hypothetical protein QR685DRAFT_522272 [Neurospora intermedia]|uniref:Uncharacterized protein n=1 Tax=Neurospora intermedia TaxID=5142 RepID=A0ABR3DIM3_NEUIN
MGTSTHRYLYDTVTTGVDGLVCLMRRMPIPYRRTVELVVQGAGKTSLPHLGLGHGIGSPETEGCQWAQYVSKRVRALEFSRWRTLNRLRLERCDWACRITLWGP